MKLTLGQRIFVSKKVEDLFDAAKARLLGRFFKGSAIYFQVMRDSDPMDTIEGMYHYVLNTLYGAGARPDQETIAHLAEVTGNFMDAQKLKVKNYIMADIANAQTWKQAQQAVATHVSKSTDYLGMLVANETKIVQAYANKEGIARVASDIGVSDPTVCWLGVIDNKICKWCKSMYHDTDNLAKPRPWKMSQLKDGYFKPKLWNGKSVFNSAHPRCRHTMVFIPPNFGYNESGKLEFISLGYDYYNDYHGIAKSEPELMQPPAEFFISYDEFLKNANESDDIGHDHEHE